MKNTIENYKKQILAEREKQIDELQDVKRSYDSLSPLFLAEESVLDRLVQLRCEIKRLETEIDRKRLEALPTNKKYVNRFLYSDIQPYEVIEEITPCKLIARKMLAVETEESIKARQESFVPGGFCGHTDNSVQRWQIESNPDGEVVTLRKHKDGSWYMAGDRTRFILNDYPIKHYDFNF